VNLKVNPTLQQESETQPLEVENCASLACENRAGVREGKLGLIM